MLKLHDLSRVHRTDAMETVALDGVTLEIARGEFVAVMGPSGCGKSSLLNIIGLLDRPTSGMHFFLDQDVTRLEERRAGRLRGRHIGFIFQNFNLIEDLSVAENIELPLLYQNVGAGERRRRVAAVMDETGVAHRARYRPGELSGGQQQRVAVARAVVSEPSLLLADEPTGNLDSVHGQEVMSMLRALNDHGTTIIMATHSALHAGHASRTVHLFDGRIVSERRGVG